MNIKTLNYIVFITTITLGWFGGSVLADVSEQDFDYSFWPFKNGVPETDGITPGKTVINAGNVETYKHVLDPGTYQFLKDGELELSVGKTLDFPMHEKFIDASRKNINVGFDEKGLLTNYINGRPFPFPPRENDPDAGLKLIWNFEYGRTLGDLACLDPWYWEYWNMKTNKLERTIKFDYACFKRYAFKTTDGAIPEDAPNPDQVYRKIYLSIAEPFDLKNTQLLIQKYKDDTHQMDGWLYLGFQRRVRRFPTGQMTDAFLGSDIMIEDFEGFEGQVSDFDWQYQGTQTLLMPMWNHNEAVKGKEVKYTYTEENGEEFKYIPYKGKNGKCFPDAPWQLRKVHVVKGSPKDKNHPLSHRLHFIDSQTNEMPITLIYDRAGNYWKWFHIGWPQIDNHLEINKGKGAMMGDTASFVDVQAKHCTTTHFRTRVDEKLVKDSLFTVQQMRAAGR